MNRKRSENIPLPETGVPNLLRRVKEGCGIVKPSYDPVGF
jgi:hypothetical protein